MTNSASPSTTFTIVVPCYNEEGFIAETIENLSSLTGVSDCYEILVVDDGSDDGTASILEEMIKKYANLRIITHSVNRGYGAALKTGIRHSVADLVAITDADGTYPNERLPELVARCATCDMVVGARTGQNVIYSKLRAFPKMFLRRWISWLSRTPVPDINSGMRVFRKKVAEEFFGVLPDTFSFTITITLAMLTNYRKVEFIPIDYAPRVGTSKIKPVRDTIRFVVLILRTATYFAPVRVFLPFIALMFVLFVISGIYDIFVLEDITDKTILLFLSVLNIGMFTLLADMIDKRT